MSDKINNLFNKVLLELVKDRITVDSTEEDIELILEDIDKNILYKHLIFDSAKNNAIFFRKTMFEEVSKVRKDDDEFISKQGKQWESAFIASDAMYIMTIEAAESYITTVNKMDQKNLREQKYTFTALMYIHGRALQQFLEIITLMKNGFADGAYARWRSMYELAIISSFIKEHGEPVAKEFINSHDSEDRYQWAMKSNLFNKKKWITFSDIEKNCGIDRKIWKNQYILANRIIHASPQGTFSRLSDTGEYNIMLVGRSNFGFTTPAEHSAISLAQITADFLTIHESGDALVSVSYINNWIDIIKEEYFKTHDSLFPNEEKLWDDSLVSYRKYIDE